MQVEVSGDDQALFVDTNVLVYANVIEAPQHEAALRAMNDARDCKQTLWISRQVIREYLSLMTRPQAFGALSRETVLNQVDIFLDQLEIADETSVVTDTLCRLMDSIQIGGKQVHDANIVATMISYGIPALLTHNTADFYRFSQRIRIETLICAN